MRYWWNAVFCIFSSITAWRRKNNRARLSLGWHARSGWNIITWCSSMEKRITAIMLIKLSRILQFDLDGGAVSAVCCFPHNTSMTFILLSMGQYMNRQRQPQKYMHERLYPYSILDNCRTAMAFWGNGVSCANTKWGWSMTTLIRLPCLIIAIVMWDNMMCIRSSLWGIIFGNLILEELMSHNKMYTLGRSECDNNYIGKEQGMERTKDTTNGALRYILLWTASVFHWSTVQQ